ncbi:MAG TPA: hypothetical protein V6D05_00425 [Stenomitos sp.]
MDRDVLWFGIKVLCSALIIAGASGLSTRSPLLAGYITALPLMSILALSFAYLQNGNGEAASRYAVSVLAAIPASLLFFVPFLFYSRLKGSWWLYLAAGIALLYVGSFLQRAIASRLLS